jgi:secreted trypsin-like serine protease
MQKDDFDKPHLPHPAIRAKRKRFSWLSLGLCASLVLLAPLTSVTSYAQELDGKTPESQIDEQLQIVSPRIVGGNQVSISTAPWQVALIFTQAPSNYMGLFCGGSLISDVWIVTAAHCVVFESGRLAPSSVGIQTGNATLSKSALSFRTVSEIIVHPEYRVSSKNHDIALIRLSTPVTLGGNTQAISIFRSEVANNTLGYATGWGETTVTTSWGDYWGGVSNFPTTLHGTNLWVADNNCWGESPGSYRSDLMICAGTFQWRNDTCQGDSGGPLAIRVSRTYMLAGITSFGAGCAWLSPGIYTKVSRYASWIDDKTALKFSTIPTISGFAAVGQTLTATAGSWDPSPDTTSFQWLANNSPISRATGSTYVVRQADLTRTISVRVTGNKSGYRTAVVESSRTLPVSPPMPFSETSRPTVSGSFVKGQTLTADPGSWSPTPTLSYQWLSNNRAIRGATSSTYVLTAADVGKLVSVQLTGTLSGYQTTSNTWGPSTAILDGFPFFQSPAPSISGSAVVGQTMTAGPGSWDPSPSLSYQWLSNNSPIKGATGTSFTLRTADIGKRISVRVTGTRAGYVTTSMVSEPSAAVTSGFPFQASPLPTISGSTIVGQQLTAVAGDWSPTPSFTYQWLANNSVIRGATGQTFVVTNAQRGRQISVRVTAVLATYESTSRVSSALSIPR